MEGHDLFGSFSSSQTISRLAARTLKRSQCRGWERACSPIGSSPGPRGTRRRRHPDPESPPGPLRRKTASDFCAGAEVPAPTGEIRARPTSRLRRPASSSSRRRSPGWPLHFAKWPALTVWSRPPPPCAAGPVPASPAGQREVRSPGPEPGARRSRTPPGILPSRSYLQHRVLLLLSWGHEGKKCRAHASPRTQ